MKQFLMTICGFLFITSVAMADDTTVEKCANGAGTVVVGTVTGHKYCMSNNSMNWWNAYSWCDAQGRRLISLDDCGCSVEVNCHNVCAEFKQMLRKYGWTATPGDLPEDSYAVYMESTISNFSLWPRNASGRYAMCY